MGRYRVCNSCSIQCSLALGHADLGEMHVLHTIVSSALMQVRAMHVPKAPMEYCILPEV